MRTPAKAISELCREKFRTYLRPYVRTTPNQLNDFNPSMDSIRQPIHHGLNGATKRDTEYIAVAENLQQVTTCGITHAPFNLVIIEIIIVNDDDSFESIAFFDSLLQVGVPVLRLQNFHNDIPVLQRSS